MKAKPTKLGIPGKFGSVAGKSGKVALPATKNLQTLDAKSVGSAMGVLAKHHK